MNVLFKSLCIIFCAVSIVGCSPAPKNTYAAVQPPVKVALNAVDDCVLTYTDFEKDINQPSRRAANHLFQKIIPEADLNSYGVDLIEVDVDISEQDKSQMRSGTIFAYEFVGKNIKSKYQKPTLTISYIVADENGFSDVHNQNIVIAGFRQKRELAMVKKNFGDSIASFKTKEFGPELQYVVRAIDGPKNMMAWIRFSDNLSDSQISKDEMIARIQSLDENDIFPLDLVRYKVQEDLRDLDVKFDTLAATDAGFIECGSCKESGKQTVHVNLKTNKEVPELKCVVLRPFIATVIQEEIYSVESNKDISICLSNQSAIPGERLVLSVQVIRKPNPY